MKCQRCGKENPPHYKFCLECGARVEQLECPKCGLKNAPGAVKCALCDAPLGSPAGAIDEVPVVGEPSFSSGPKPARGAPAPRPARAKPVMALAFVIMIAAGVLGVWITMRSSEPAGSPESPTPEAAHSEVPLAEQPGRGFSDPDDYVLSYIREVLKILKANMGDCEKAVKEAQAYAENNKVAFEVAVRRRAEMENKMSGDQKRAYDDRLMKKSESILMETTQVMTEFSQRCPDASEKLGGVLGQ